MTIICLFSMFVGWTDLLVLKGFERPSGLSSFATLKELMFFLSDFSKSGKTEVLKSDLLNLNPGS